MAGRRTLRAALALVSLSALAGTACGSGPATPLDLILMLDLPAVDGSVVPADVADLATDPVGVDAADAAPPADASPDGPPRGPCPITTPDGCQAIGPDEVLQLGDEPVLEMPGVTFAIGESDLLAVFPRYDEGRVYASGLLETPAAGPPSPPAAAPAALPFGLASDTTGATSGDTRVILFVGRQGAAVGVQRATVDAEGTVGTVAPVVLQDQDGSGAAEVTPYWPQAAPLPDGRILLGFVDAAADARRRAFLGVSEDGGQTFAVRAAPQGDTPRLGSLVHVGATASGAWVLTYQEATPSFLFTSFAVVSSDQGESWSDPVVVAPELDNVHDAYVVARRDQGADLYYLHDGGRLEFNVFRRPLNDDGTVGPEQRVTAVELGHVEKPQPRRLPDGRLAMGLARRLAEMDYRLVLSLLDGDAPAE